MVCAGPRAEAAAPRGARPCPALTSGLLLDTASPTLRLGELLKTRQTEMKSGIVDGAGLCPCWLAGVAGLCLVQMSGVFQIIDPPPPHRTASAYPPPLVRGEHTLAGRRGVWGGSIFWKTTDTALYSTNVSTL
jgi:hypothetical protein